MNKFSNDGSFMDMFKKMSNNKQQPPSCIKAESKYNEASSASNKNSLSRAFKQMSKDKVYSKPTLVFDSVNEDPVDSNKSHTAKVKKEFNEYDACFPDKYEEPVTKETYMVIDKLVESVLEHGEDMERIIFNDQKDNPEFWFLHDKNSDTYRFYQKQLKTA